MELIYDFKDALPNFAWLIGILILFLIRIGIKYYRSIEGTEEDNGKHSADYNASGLSIVGFFILVITMVVLYFSVVDFIILKGVYKKNTYKAVEGRVVKYRPSDCNREPQQFTINNIDFILHCNSSYLYGYNKTNCDGNKINEGIYVKVIYTELHFQKVILKLEIKK